MTTTTTGDGNETGIRPTSLIQHENPTMIGTSSNEEPMNSEEQNQRELFKLEGINQLREIMPGSDDREASLCLSPLNSSLVGAFVTTRGG